MNELDDEFADEGSPGPMSLLVAKGLEVRMPEQLDLTYQVVPDYDDRDPVLVGWDGEDALYFIAFSELPPGWIDPEEWLSGLQRDLEAANGEEIDLVSSGSYKSAGDCVVTYIEFGMQVDGGSNPQRQIASFLVNKNRSYAVFSSLIEQSAADKMLKDTCRILQSACEPSSNVIPLRAKNEDRYVGLWSGEEEGDDGVFVSVAFELKKDLSFTGWIGSKGAATCEFSGVWSICGAQFHWDYLFFSEPAARKRVDVDEIKAYDGQTLILVSQETGKERSFRRIKP